MMVDMIGSFSLNGDGAWTSIVMFTYGNVISLAHHLFLSLPNHSHLATE